MSVEHITIITLGVWRPYEGTETHYVQSFGDIKNIVKNTKFHETSNFLPIGIHKGTYVYDTKDIIETDNLKNILWDTSCPYVPGTIQLCSQKNKPKTLSDVVLLYKLSGVYYRISAEKFEDFEFYVTDKIQYETDIEKRFKNNYVHNTNPSKAYSLSKCFPSEYPAVPCMWYKEKGKTYNVYLVEFGDKIIVDRDTNQIWPRQTNKMPNDLIQLFSKVKEKVNG